MRPRATLSTSTSSCSAASTATDASMGVPTPGTPTYANAATSDSSAGEAGSGAHQLVPVPLPVGSVRASLGALSTFEDCYALVRFLGTTFKDFQVNDQDMLTGVKMVSVLLGAAISVTRDCCLNMRVARGGVLLHGGALAPLECHGC